MTAIKIATYDPRYFAGVAALWQEVFPDDPPWNAAEFAIPAKLAHQPDLFFVALDADRVVGSIMAGYDGHRGWLYAVGVSNAHRRQNIGSALVHKAEVSLRSLGCGKINLQIRSTNDRVAEFYRKLGYVTEERISMGKRITDPSGIGDDHLKQRSHY